MDDLSVKVREYENILKDIENIVDGRASERIRNALDKVGLMYSHWPKKVTNTQHSMRQTLIVLIVLPRNHKAVRPSRTMSQSTLMILLRPRRLAHWKQ